MAAVSDAYGFYLGQPWWLLASLVIVPMIWLARRNLATLGRGRRIAAIALRVAVVLLLAVLLARPMLVQKSRRTTVIAVLDRSQSIPAELAEAALDYLSKAVASQGRPEPAGRRRCGRDREHLHRCPRATRRFAGETRS